MGKLVEIPDCIWTRMTKEQKEEYYKQQKKSNIFVGSSGAFGHMGQNLSCSGGSERISPKGEMSATSC